jgi:hypothetical protein
MLISLKDFTQTVLAMNFKKPDVMEGYFRKLFK